MEEKVNLKKLYREAREKRGLKKEKPKELFSKSQKTKEPNNVNVKQQEENKNSEEEEEITDISKVGTVITRKRPNEINKEDRELMPPPSPRKIPKITQQQPIKNIKNIKNENIKTLPTDFFDESFNLMNPVIIEKRIKSEDIFNKYMNEVEEKIKEITKREEEEGVNEALFKESREAFEQNERELIIKRLKIKIKEKKNNLVNRQNIDIKDEMDISSLNEEDENISLSDDDDDDLWRMKKV